MHVWLRLLKTKLLKLLKGSSGPQEETFQRFLRASFGIVNCLPLGSAFLFLSDRFHYWLFQHQLPWQSPQEVFCHRARATSRSEEHTSETPVTDQSRMPSSA